MTRRLFIFASYDVGALVDESLLYYLRVLSALGDIVFTMDNDAADTELDKVRMIPNVLQAMGQRHAEYDFGSYKRGFFWALENNLLKNYDKVYFVNDSCYAIGPMDNLIARIEALDGGMTGVFKKIDPMHLQSFFIKFDPVVFNAKWFADFLGAVKHEDNKLDIVRKYEIGLSFKAYQEGVKLNGILENKELLFYDAPTEIIKSAKIPLLKKMIYTIGRYHWSHRRAAAALACVPDECKAFVLENAVRCTNCLAPAYKYKKYASEKRLNSFITVVRKHWDTENDWVMLFGVVQIGKVEGGKIYLFSKFPIKFEGKVHV